MYVYMIQISSKSFGVKMYVRLIDNVSEASCIHAKCYIIILVHEKTVHRGFYLLKHIIILT